MLKRYMSPDLTSLLDVLLAVNRALEFTKECDASAFHADKRTRWAVYSQIIVIGEAAARISRDFQRNHPEIPWADMIGMRHRLVHGYDEVKWDRVWDTVVVDLPKLKGVIAPLIPKQ